MFRGEGEYSFDSFLVLDNKILEDILKPPTPKNIDIGELNYCPV